MDTGLRRYDGFFEVFHVFQHPVTSSAEAKRVGTELFHHLGFSAHHQLARLALGRSLGEPDFPPPATDARGFNIKGNHYCPVK
jgi:hypothetical protein